MDVSGSAGKSVSGFARAAKGFAPWKPGRNRGGGLRVVRAVHAGAHGLRQVLAERGAGVLDPAHGVGEAAADVDACALDRGAGAALAAAQAEGGGELVGDGVELGAQAGVAGGVVRGLGLVELGAQVGDALLVGGARLGVEALAGVAAVGAARAG
jgi:hypothetical protein